MQRAGRRPLAQGKDRQKFQVQIVDPEAALSSRGAGGLSGLVEGSKAGKRQPAALPPGGPGDSATHS